MRWAVRSTLTDVGRRVLLLLGIVSLLPVGRVWASAPVPVPDTPDVPDVPDGTVPAPPTDDLGTVSGGSDIDVSVTLPLVVVPQGCDAPVVPHVVFVGTAAERDVRSVRFRVDSVRAGRTAPYAVSDPITGEVVIDVRYGLDAPILDVGSSYLVSAAVDPDLGVLLSKVTDPVEDFGGDEVIGVSESDLDCPDLEDPVRTLRPDGTEIDHGPLDGFLGERTRLALSIAVPFAAAFAAVFLLAMFRLGVSGVARGLRPPERSPGVR
jgi:hypothetical protein